MAHTPAWKVSEVLQSVFTRVSGSGLLKVCSGAMSAAPERPRQARKVSHDDTYHCRLTRASTVF